VLVALFLLFVFGNLFFFRVITPFAFGLFILGLQAFVLITAKNRHKSMWFLGLTAVFAVGVLGVRAGNFVRGQSIVILLTTLSVIWYQSLSNSGKISSFTDVFLSPLFAGLTYIKKSFMLLFPKTLTALYRRGVMIFGSKEAHSKTVSTLVGIGLAIPITVILLAMFSASDPIYYSYVKKIISPEFLTELPWRIVFSIILICVSLPLVFPDVKRIAVSPGQILGRFKFSRELTIVMGVTALVIASFIAIQWPYIFANVRAETDLSQFGVATYAEYVKKGFVELLRACVFIYGLIWMGLTALRQIRENKSKLLTILQWVVMGEFLVVLVSIFRRVYLYQSLHGLTLIRIYGALFLVWLLFMTITIAGRHVTNKIRFGLWEGIFTLLIFVVIGTWNAEKYIAIQFPPTVNHRIDYVYLSRLSADGADGWVMAYNHAKQIILQYFAETGNLDKNARREIAYAYYIIRNMTYRYFVNMPKYADKAEYVKYTDAVLKFQEERLSQEHLELTLYKRRPDENWVASRMGEIEKMKKSQNISIYQQNALPVFENSNSPTLQSFYDSYQSAKTTNNLIDKYEKIKNLDRVYMLNSSEMDGFLMMKEKIPLTELHELQIKYYELYNRIATQQERDYEKDISLESPLL